MGRDHPISWCRDVDGGRSWYTGLGHASGLSPTPTSAGTWPGGIRSRDRRPEVECGATIWRNFQKTLLTREVGEPMDSPCCPTGAC